MEIFSQTNIDIITRLAVAMFLGSLIGLEREVARKYAGLRTYTMVALGAALFAALSEAALWRQFENIPGFDPSRIVSNIVVGVGFLGAGMVVFHREKVLGLTTAAGIWVTAAIGAAVGIGAYVPAITTTLFVLFVLLIMRQLEIKLKMIGDENLARPKGKDESAEPARNN
jgi:putative Mg2+ transporter-C (MgtC) family protein